MKVKLPKDKYIKGIEVNADHLDISFAPKKKVALLFVNINHRYWPYMAQVAQDCKTHFLPHHKVDFHVWSDAPKKDDPNIEQILLGIPTQAGLDKQRAEGGGIPCFSREVIKDTLDRLWAMDNLNLYETEPIDWPAPTLMRYHLFLQQEEKLKDYDYVFYLDADMRVVTKIGDEVLGEGLTTAPHPGYVLNSRLIPPYEPNIESQAYIPRLGRVIVDETGKNRFVPFYAAGGFQGGKTKLWLKAMHKMKESIDRDFNKNYIAIWNDESHWNKYLWNYQQNGGHITFLDVSYIYPDSLIKEYYEPIWGRSYEPKIVTLTKPFSLSKQAGEELNRVFGANPHQFPCPACGATLQVPGHKIVKVLHCDGQDKPHQVDMIKL